MQANVPTLATDRYPYTATVVDNRSGACALSSGWKLYFNFVRLPLAAGPPGEPGDTARRQLADQGLELTHGDLAQSGDLYVLTPTAGARSSRLRR